MKIGSPTVMPLYTRLVKQGFVLKIKQSLTYVQVIETKGLHLIFSHFAKQFIYKIANIVPLLAYSGWFQTLANSSDIWRAQDLDGGGAGTIKRDCIVPSPTHAQ